MARKLVSMRDSWSGTVVLVAQPAEERGLGARAMIEDGLFKRFPRPDYNLGLHVTANLPAGQAGFGLAENFRYSMDNMVKNADRGH